MRVVRGEGRPAELPRGAVVSIGNFDGIHRGQRSILDRLIFRARELGLFSAIVTFDPHPLAVLRPGSEPPKLATDSQRQRFLSETLGLDELWIVPFTPELARTSAEEFVERVLVDGLGAREVHVGSHFTFGRGREGNLQRLVELGKRHGFAAIGHDELREAGEPVSSTRIRRAVAAGEVERAAELLGRPYAVLGPVVAGDRVGRQLGWPTANVALADERVLLPADGVYVTESRSLAGEERWPGVTNVGVRPTREGSGIRRVETHLFDFDGDLYGTELEVAFLQRLRGEKRFESLDALRAQIAADVEIGREYFSTRGRSFDRTPDGTDRATRSDAELDELPEEPSARTEPGASTGAPKSR